MSQDIPVADVQWRHGSQSDGRAFLTIEVPHGADRTVHFETLMRLMTAPLPADLVDFFHVNTDVGAWALAVSVAEQVVARRPDASVQLIRCLIPRTLIDTNRVVEHADGDLAKGGVTSAIPSYVGAADHPLLLALHRRYVDLATRAIDETCSAGGYILLPHTYAPRSVGVARIDQDIVANMRQAWAPDVFPNWPIRAEVDLITQDADGNEKCVPNVVASLRSAYAALDINVEVGGAYYLHPATQGAAHALRHPGKTLCLEIRRDLVVDVWSPFEEMTPSPPAIERMARPIADFFSTRPELR
jgi:hypothetical protein